MFLLILLATLIDLIISKGKGFENPQHACGLYGHRVRELSEALRSLVDELKGQATLSSQERQRMITQLRSDVLRNAHQKEGKHVKKYLDGHADYHAIRKHLAPNFVEALESSGMTLFALADNSVLNSMERRFFDELDRLENEWSLEQ